jgi:hypothetical protein
VPVFGTVTVNIPASEPFTSVQLSCTSIAPQRGNFAGGVASVPNVPTSEDCTLNFKGGPPAMFRPVRGGQTLSCTFTGATASCR